MKKILGLDLGTTSIGWALIESAENETEKSSITAIGSRVVPLSTDEVINFAAGKSITTNADRTLKRGMRRNRQRFLLRREKLILALKEANIFDSQTIYAENGKESTYDIMQLRAKAVEEKISLKDFGRVLLNINKKRGYQSNRKAKSADEGEIIDSIGVSKELFNKGITPGQFVYERIKNGKFSIPDFYKSDVESEFHRIWNTQASFYPEILSNSNKDLLWGKSKNLFVSEFERIIGGSRAEFKGKKAEKLAQLYEWRARAISEKIELSVLVEILTEVNNQINSASNYLAKIGDRSKILALSNQTIGQYQWALVSENPEVSLKNVVFYRQDYEDEFERIWETQSKFYAQLNDSLKQKIKDAIIFYQRPLKSQKGLIGFCEFESSEKDIEVDGKKKTIRIGSRVAPKSSPVFQDFKVWQTLNNIKISVDGEPERSLFLGEKVKLYRELSCKEKLSKTEISKVLGKRRNSVELVNFEDLSGNITIAKLYEAYNKIALLSGHDKIDVKKQAASDVQDAFSSIFETIGLDPNITNLNIEGDMKEIMNTPLYQLWHLLYSYEGDKSRTGNEALIKQLKNKFGFSEEAAKVMIGVTFENDYGSLSSKAILKILPHLKSGLEYSEACKNAGYNHSGSMTTSEREQRKLKDKLDLLPKNSLRNPVVEKILNQMVNVINSIIDTYGKPDGIRIELARELKKNAAQRKSMTDQLNETRRKHELYKARIKEEFGLSYVSRNDLIKYKLYLELAENGYKPLYPSSKEDDVKIGHDQLFTKNVDIEHIIPKAKLFDDSFSNKTLAFRKANIEKGDSTALDYMASKGADRLDQYKKKIQSLNNISPRKKKLLLMEEEDIPKDFLERDLRNSQYIAKKALAMLNETFNDVLSTTGKITQELRSDWQLVDVLKELNWEKYNAVGMTYYVETKDGQTLRRIKDWDKRNDHRHHAMDALAIAFTTRRHISYLNNLNAQSSPERKISRIKEKLMTRDKNGKWRFTPPMPLNDFREQAKKHLEGLLVSFKAKNKVVTKSINRIKTKNGTLKVVQDTPRGQLHNETIYGKSSQYVTTEVAVNGSLDSQKIALVARKKYRIALLNRLNEFGGDPKKAFTGKNSLKNNPIYLDEHQLTKVPEKVKLVKLETIYTIRKAVGPDLNIKKVLDPIVKQRLEERLADHNGNPKTAFADLDENPIWLNEEQQIPIKHVKIRGVENAVPIHTKRNHLGEPILDETGKPEDTAFVSTGNNHHVAIYEDENGQLYEEVVSLFDAVARKNYGLPVVNPTHESGAKLIFTLKQNEYFVFPNSNAEFSLSEFDLMDPSKYGLISPNLFRVQKITSKDYFFRHHLETQLNYEKSLKGVTWNRISSLSNLIGLQKVRIDHLGRIVSVGEY